MLPVELHTTTNLSFLRGASAPEELVAAAAALGHDALGITDHATVAALPAAHVAARAAGIRLIPGVRLDPTDFAPLLLYPTDRAAYARLTALLTAGKRRAGKGGCALGFAEIAAAAEGQIAILLADPPSAAALAALRDAFPDRAHLALTPSLRPGEAVRLERLARAAAAAAVPIVATGDARYHAPDRRILADVLTCIREHCTIETAGARLEPGGMHLLRAPEETARLLARYPEALARTRAIADACRFSLDALAYQYPDETESPGETPQATLERLTWAGAARRYGEAIPPEVAAQLRHELALIARLDYAPYFLTVNSIVRFARARGILCQGRGSAANSAVCYVLGITSIDPVRSGLLFERFISAARREPPDIDVDFDHERREEVIQWIYDSYGRDRAALAATVIRYRARGAIRDVGKALGLPEDVTAALARQASIWSEDGATPEQARAIGLDPADRRLALALDLARRLIGFPRHRSQHPGGFVLTRDRLDALVPIEPAAMADRQVIEWDKDDIAQLRFMKVDILGLGMLGCLTRAFDLLRARGTALDLATIPPEDPATYAMIRRADTLGVFQIESRAQMAMLPRLAPRRFYDLVIEVALVRPGPIQGDMVHPYLRRREGREKVSYPTKELQQVLGKTLGVPLFQEQAMQVAITCAGFTAEEADALRRAMATFKFTGGVSHFRDKLIAGMVARGYARDFAERTFTQIEGFGSYGFPESHAASFALIAYGSSWLKCHHPDVFACALLNAQPMGFYAPAQIVADARAHGVAVRGVDAMRSAWDCTLEPELRLGLRLVKGLAEAEAARLIAARPFTSIGELWRRSGLSPAALRALAEADAFACLGRDRRGALWDIAGLPAAPLPLFAAAEATEPAAALAPLPAAAAVLEDYRATGLSLRAHPVSFLRDALAARGMLPCAALAGARDGLAAEVAGLVLVRQRPGSARGVLFVTLEDETGFANLIVWPDRFARDRPLLLTAALLAARGRVQREGRVVHLIADGFRDLTGELRALGRASVPPARDFR
jgi:error-prone DNA polymerase